MVTAERLRDVLYYDEKVGVFTWRALINNRIKVGMTAGCQNISGYLHIRVDGVRYSAHRLAWLYVYGELPKSPLDHINGDKTDNRVANLRDGSKNVNQQNIKAAFSNNKTGLLGASPYRGKFRALIRVAGKQVHLGIFATPELAHATYLEAKRIHHEGCTI